MSGLTWWANRKSRLGLNNVIAQSPHRLPNGSEWWTSPPIAPPQPEHIEYVLEFQQRLVGRGGNNAQKMAKLVADWLREARRLLHESVESDDGDLHTTDGLMIATSDMIHRLFSKLEQSGYKVDTRDREIAQAIHSRGHKSLRERAMKRGA